MGEKERYFNPRAPRGARRAYRPKYEASYRISIHAPREGRDRAERNPRHHRRDISIHAPREGRDRRPAVSTSRQLRFQSTRPARGATTVWAEKTGRIGISIHAPREGRDNFCLYAWFRRSISIHSPREGRDGRRVQRKHFACAFQSTRPARGATFNVGDIVPFFLISIHAPREGRDWHSDSRADRRCYFNPRAPCGARLW